MNLNDFLNEAWTGKIVSSPKNWRYEAINTIAGEIKDHLKIKELSSDKYELQLNDGPKEVMNFETALKKALKIRMSMED